MLQCALLYGIQYRVSHCSYISNTLWGIVSWNVGKFFFLPRYISHDLGWLWIGWTDLYTSLWIQYRVIHCSSISNSFWGVESLKEEKFFFFPRYISQGLGWLRFGWARMYTFLHFQNQGAMWRCLSFPAPSEALKLGKVFSFFARLLLRSFSQTLDSLKCILYAVGYMHYSIYA